MKESELYRAEMSEAREAGFSTASELFDAYKTMQEQVKFAMPYVLADARRTLNTYGHADRTYNEAEKLAKYAKEALAATETYKNLKPANTADQMIYQSIADNYAATEPKGE